MNNLLHSNGTHEGMMNLLTIYKTSVIDSADLHVVITFFL